MAICSFRCCQRTWNLYSHRILLHVIWTNRFPSVLSAQAIQEIRRRDLLVWSSLSGVVGACFPRSARHCKVWSGVGQETEPLNVGGSPTPLRWCCLVGAACAPVCLVATLREILE